MSLFTAADKIGYLLWSEDWIIDSLTSCLGWYSESRSQSYVLKEWNQCPVQRLAALEDGKCKVQVAWLGVYLESIPVSQMAFLPYSHHLVGVMHSRDQICLASPLSLFLKDKESGRGGVWDSGDLNSGLYYLRVDKWAVFFLSGYWKLSSFIWALLLKYHQILLLGSQGNTYKYYYFGD